MARWAPVIAVLILSLLLGSMAQDPNPPSAPENPSNTSAPLRWDGITILYNAEDPWSVFESDLSRAIQWGAPCIQIQVSFFSRDHSSAGFPVFDRRSPSTDQLQRIAEAVKAHDKTLVFHPVLLIQDPKSSRWRGQYSPLDDDEWWGDYTQWIESLAITAQASQVDLLFIGSELTSLQTESARWANLIQTVRNVFDGSVGYSANWDSWQQVPFHSQLDLLALNGYFPMDRSEEANDPSLTPEEDRARLLPHWSALKQWTQGNETPVIFSEVGYPAAAKDLSQPWNSNQPQTPLNGALQKRGFEAFLSVFGQSDLHGGILFYALHGHDPATPSGYTPILEETKMLWQKQFQESLHR